jgi:hypothetical protein
MLAFLSCVTIGPNFGIASGSVFRSMQTRKVVQTSNHQSRNHTGRWDAIYKHPEGITAHEIIDSVSSAVQQGFLPPFFLKHVEILLTNIRSELTLWQYETLSRSMKSHVELQSKYCLLFEGGVILATLGLPLYVSCWIMDWLISDKDIAHIAKIRRLETIYEAFKRRAAVNPTRNNLQLIPYVAPAEQRNKE